jgi:membrane protein YqaA with SNARE-associated domain
VGGGGKAAAGITYTANAPLKTITHILSRYTAFLWALLKPLGAWGVMLAAGLDGSLFGLPVDAIVAGYVYADRHRFWLYVLMASAGSAIGSMVVYAVGYEGGEALLRKRMSEERFKKIHDAFDKHPFWSLMFPAMLPPPTPFKLFVLAAAVSEMRFTHFLLAIFCGRLVRFFALALLTLKFGPQIVTVMGTLVSRHTAWLVSTLALGIAIWVVMHQKRKKTRKKA